MNKYQGLLHFMQLKSQKGHEMKCCEFINKAVYLIAST